MKDFKTFVLHSSLYKDAFDKLFNNVSWKSHHLEFMVDAETKKMWFFRTLLKEETSQDFCSAEQASYQGEQVLILLDRLYALMDNNAENHHQLTMLSISTAIWIAEHNGKITELELVVSAIASFANQTSQQQDLEELYEITLQIIYATDDFIKADLDKRNYQRPWRYLCLNHCIIATRTGNGELARLSYDRLIEYIPEEAEAFFTMGMQKVNTGKYSLHCQNMIQAYYEMYRTDQPHKSEMSIRLN